MKTLRVGLLGLGQVGTGVYRLLTQKKVFLAKEAGVRFDLAKVAVRRKSKKRSVKVPKRLLTENPMEIVRDPSIDVVVEVMGGVKKARVLVLEALRRGKHVVTANKALLAEAGDAIFQTAHRHNRWVFFEASVGGGIPVIKGLREGLVANRFDAIYSIINGTCNYILSQMTERKVDFKEALAEAQACGYAEPDPTLDIEGVDSAHKLAILARFAFGGRVKFSDIYSEGISSIRSEDIAFAEEFGYRIKLLAIAKRAADGIEARVQPTLLPKSHILSHVEDAYNAVLLHGDEVGRVLFYGRGAGPRPTASAVVSDLVDVALREHSRFSREFAMRGLRRSLRIKSISSILSRYYLRFHVVDRPGVLSKITHVLGAHKIGISDVIQKERSEGSVVPLILLTHKAHEHSVRTAMQGINRQHVIRGKSQVIRIEDNS